MMCVAIAAKAQRIEKGARMAFPGGKAFIFRVQLCDKRGSAYTLDHPERFLSAKALNRRARQRLRVDSTDLPLSATYLGKLRSCGFQVVGGSKWNNTVLVRSGDSAVAARLASLEFVRGVKKVYTTPDSVNRPQPLELQPDTTRNSNPKGGAYGQSCWQISQLQGQALHERGFRGKGMTIAILDGGFMNADKIPALNRAHVIATRDCAWPYNQNIYSLIDHGTMVLSCMAAQDSGRILGDAPEASYVLIRTEIAQGESLLEEDNWAMGAEYADSIGADLINSSLGYNQYDDKTTSYRYRDLNGRTALISRTASMLAGKGIVLVNSAGNSGMGEWKKIGVPADAPDILTVGALGTDGKNAPFSSIGPSADGRVKPDVMAPGFPVKVISGNGVVKEANGTSFASPITCGLVACLWQALPGKTALEIMDLVRRSADNFSTPDNIFGYGKPDFAKALKLAE